MKKTIMMALAIAAGTAFAAMPAKKKKTSKAKPQQTEQRVQLKTASDSVSFAGGMATTRGLNEFIRQQYGVDTANMADFVEGFKEAMTKTNDPKFAARVAGAQIAKMVESRILPQTKSSFEGSKHQIDSALFNAGFIAAISGDTATMDMKEAASLFTSTLEADRKAKAEAWKAKNEQWMAENAKKPGVKTTPSGLQYKVITAGTGATPKATDKVTVKYEGRTIDGTEFDSSYKRNPQTTEFRANQVIKGWTEALTMMPVGSKWELYIPQQLAYGERQAGKIQPYSTLIFTVELVKTEPEAAPAASNDKAKAANKKGAKAKKASKKK